MEEGSSKRAGESNGPGDQSTEGNLQGTKKQRPNPVEYEEVR